MGEGILKKYKAEDIKIFTYREYVLEAILDKFGSLEEFCLKVRLDRSTVLKYLRRDNLGTHKFKIKLVNALNKGLDEILVTKEDQIKNYVDKIYNNIEQYTEKDDLLTFQKVKNLILQNNLSELLPYMYYCMAYNYYKCENIDSATEYINIAINKSQAYGNGKLLFMCYCHLGLIYFHEAQFRKAKEAYDLANNLLKSLNPDDKSKFTFYYRFGQLLFCDDFKNYEQSRKEFTKALECCSDVKNRGRTMLNIGLTYKKQGQYSKALEYYNYAIDIYGNEFPVNKSIVYNNIAELLKCQGQYDEALTFIKKALSLLGANLSQD